MDLPVERLQGRQVRIVTRTWDKLYRARRKLATAGVALLALLLGLHVVFGANGMLAYEHKRSEYRALEKEIQGLQKENQEISRRIQELKTDPQAIEKEAREQLRYAKPGEVVYTVPDSQKPPDGATAQKH